MTCRNCDNDATVHRTEWVDGRRREVYLCARCAKKAAARPATPEPTSAGPTVDAIVEKAIVGNVGGLVGELADLLCPICALRFMEYRSTGRLGCPHDYEVFAKGLLPLLLRSQGATRHVGKVAEHRRAPSASLDRLRLRAQLRDAVSREDYQAAARLRDQLRLKDADE